MSEKISTANAEHYKWGGLAGTDCDGWHLLRSADLSVIEERMPPDTSERRHYHRQSRQFFYVLAGELTLELESHEHLLRSGEGMEIAPGQPHQAMNRSANDLRMLVISQPPGHADRFDP